MENQIKNQLTLKQIGNIFLDTDDELNTLAIIIAACETSESYQPWLENGMDDSEIQEMVNCYNATFNGSVQFKGSDTTFTPTYTREWIFIYSYIYNWLND